MSAIKLGNEKQKTFKPGDSSLRNWYADRYQRVMVQRNILALVTLVALIAVLLSTVTVAQLSPLKSVQPFLITVDEKTGITQVVDPLQDKELTSRQELVQYFVVKYITARESYDVDNYQNNYQVVRLMSYPAVFTSYTKFFAPDNQASAYYVFGKHLKRSVEFLSVSPLDDKTVQVRIHVTNEAQIGKEEKNYIVLLGYTFAKMDMQLKDRYINPLGFQVTNYRLDEDYVNK